MGNIFAGIVLVATVCVLIYMAAGAGFLMVGGKAVQCRALGGEPVTDLFNISAVRCLQHQYIPL